MSLRFSSPTRRLRRKARTDLVAIVVTAIGCLLPAGCSDEDTDASLPCDVSDQACQDRIWEVVQEESQLTALKPAPPLRLLTPAELEARLTASFAEEDDDGFYLLLGLIAPNTDWKRELIEGARDSIAALYDHETKEMFVVDRGAPLNRRDMVTSTAHEMIHALQDQRFDLRAMLEAFEEDEDGALGVRGAIEGHASHFESLVNERVLQLEPDPGLLIARAQGDFDLVLGYQTNPELPWIAGYLSFPHAAGGLLAARRWAEGGTDAVNDLLVRPPDGGRALLLLRDDEVATARSVVSVATEPQPLTGWSLMERGPLGPVLLMDWLARSAQVEADAAFEQAVQSSADTAWLFRNDATSAHALLWRLGWDGDAGTGLAELAPSGVTGTVTHCYAPNGSGLVLIEGDGCDDWAQVLETAEVTISPQ